MLGTVDETFKVYMGRQLTGPFFRPGPTEDGTALAEKNDPMQISTRRLTVIHKVYFSSTKNRSLNKERHHFSADFTHRCIFFTTFFHENLCGDPGCGDPRATARGCPFLNLTLDPCDNFTNITLPTTTEAHFRYDRAIDNIKCFMAVNSITMNNGSNLAGVMAAMTILFRSVSFS